jgi:hypothetical protein
MSLLAFALLLASSSSTQLVDRTYQIPANDWSYADLGLRPQFALVNASFTVESGPPVQLLLMEQSDLERLNRGETHGMILSTMVAPSGRLQVRTAKAGFYVVVVENHSTRAETSTVHLRVSIDSFQAARLSPPRQLTVIVISFSIFFGIVTYSARRLWQAVKR